MSKTIKSTLKLLVASSLLFVSGYSYSQTTSVSSQAHEGKVSSIRPLAGTKFFSAGEDGILTQWDSDKMGEHYQVSDAKIVDFVKNPSNDDVAIIETNNDTINRVAVVDWKTLSQKYTKQYPDKILNISYSAKGTYLFICTSSVNGTYIIEAETGKVIKQITETFDQISMVKTGNSEKSAIFYCNNGKIIYYDLVNFKLVPKANFKTEANLAQPFITGTEKLSNRFLVGSKGNYIYVLDAMKGTTLIRAAVQSPIIFSSYNTDSGIYFLSATSKSNTIYHISSDDLSSHVDTPALNFQAEQVGSFNGLTAQDAITSCANIGSTTYIGTKKGIIYALSENTSLSPVSEQMYRKVIDVAAIKENFYLLTDSEIFYTSYDKKEAKTVAQNAQKQTNIAIIDSSRGILWSKNTRKAVQLVNFETGSVKNLFTPARELKSVRFFNNLVISVQGNDKNSIYAYNLSSGSYYALYTGYSIEDAVIVGRNIYIAKSNSGTADSTLISMNLQTKETVAIRIGGIYSYSLSCSGDTVYGVNIDTLGTGKVTRVFAYSINDRKVSIIYKFNQEDIRAFTSYTDGILYTNLGKKQVYAYTPKSVETKLFRRTASIPKSMAASDSRLLFVNNDGGISWYNPASQISLADWYLNTNNEWMEF